MDQRRKTRFRYRLAVIQKEYKIRLDGKIIKKEVTIYVRPIVYPDFKTMQVSKPLA